jgi:hypothetical protein
MQPEIITPQPVVMTNRKKIIMIVIIGVIFIAAVFGMIFILTYVLPSSSKSTKEATSSTVVIADYIAPKAIAGLSSSIYNQQSVSAAAVSYKLTGHNYITSTATSNTVTFFSISKSQKNDSAAIQSQTTTFMKNLGLDLVNNSGITAVKDSAITTYANDKVACQLTDSTGTLANNSPRYHSIACADTSAIGQEYIAIEKLLAIYKKAHSLPSISQVIRAVASKDNISYTILNITASNGYLRLLFAAVDNNWEYIGDLANGDQKYNTGKYIITPEVQSKISDPKYKGFIVSEIH